MVTATTIRSDSAAQDVCREGSYTQTNKHTEESYHTPSTRLPDSQHSYFRATARVTARRFSRLLGKQTDSHMYPSQGYHFGGLWLGSRNSYKEGHLKVQLLVLHAVCLRCPHHTARLILNESQMRAHKNTKGQVPLLLAKQHAQRKPAF